MDGYLFAANIVRMRRERKLTQEQLADFIGVTKASVSKWETGQTMPDIILLPQLAGFFDVTVDELIGYRPQMSKDQIRKLYQEFSKLFASRPFLEVMEQLQTYIRRYYSCYPFLFQAGILLLNHYMLSGGKEKQQEVLNYISRLCVHIEEDCRDVGLCNEAVVLRAMADLQSGRILEVMDALEEMTKPYRLSRQSGAVLSQAYILQGEVNRADSLIQGGMYSDIMSLVGNATLFLALHADDLRICEETVARIETVAEVYELSKLNPNSMAVFEYQAAQCYGMHGRKEEALCHAKKYVSCLLELLSRDRMELHGDWYFDGLEEWFEETDNGTNAPRHRKLVVEDVRESFSHPAFDSLEGDPVFERLKKRLKEIR
jgi:transcriptional regulator with XRE-family HTH domain